MKFLPTVAEMADISPTCSIIAAIAIGAITRIDVRSNFANWNCGTPKKLADFTDSNAMIALPSGFVSPAAFMITAAT